MAVIVYLYIESIDTVLMQNADHAIRLNKFLAQAGVASRRQSETMMKAGRVSVNGQIMTEPGCKIDPRHDTVQVDGKLVKISHRKLTLMMNKPRGLICSADDTQGKTVFSLIEAIPERLFTVGRLDRLSEGLLILTNDGDLAQQLTHPSFGHEKCYRVTLKRPVSPAVLQKLNTPMTLDGEAFRAASVRMIRTEKQSTVLEFVLQEGKNRQIRRMCESLDLRILRLKRIRMGGLTLGDLAPGAYRELTDREVRALRQAPRSSSRPQAPPSRSRKGASKAGANRRAHH